MTQQIVAAGNVVREKVRFVRMLFFPGLDVDNKPLKRTEFWELIKIVFGGVAFLSVVVAVLSYGLEQNVIQREYHWRHMKEAQDILKDWDQHTGEKKAAVESFFRRKHGWKSMQAITPLDALTLRDALGPESQSGSADQTGKDEFWDVRNQAIALLNYFETISTASLRGIADEEILKESLGQPMIAWRNYLREFTDLMDAQQKRLVWQPYYEVVDRWSHQDASQFRGSKKPSHDWGSFERR